MSLKQRALSATKWTALQQFGTQGIGFVVSVILARLLMPSDFGLIAMIGVFMAIGTSLMDAGLGSSLIRTQNPDQDDFSTVFFFNLIGSVVMYLLLFFSAPYIAEFYKQPLLIDIVRVYGITFIINAFGAIQTTRLTKIWISKPYLR